jgi:putative RNA 2'-phosphotransferase
MDKKKQVKVGKLLTCALRHKPEVLGITIDKNGWTDIDIMIKAVNDRGTDFTREEFDFIVENNNKKRLAVSWDGKRVRANQGHSINVDVELQKEIPPFNLYHGTKRDTVPLIKKSGILKMRRNHVHLSEDLQTASIVAGRRKGKNVILEIEARRMHNDGHTFYLSENGVWLTDFVDPKYIKEMDNT